MLIPQNPLVSICCVTYNHIHFINECLEGFLMQETDFDYEIIVHDDASIDGTRETLLAYADKYPNKFKLILQKENQWSQGVRGIFARFTFPEAKGKYIALCEGDDYWTDPLKLQKQVDLLEQNHDCSICFTDLNIFLDSETRLVKRNLFLEIKEEKLDIYSLAKRHYIYTPTVLIRWKKETFPEWMMDNIGGDTTIFLLHLEDGSKAIFLNETTTVYREHSGGLFSGRNKFSFSKRKNIEIEITKMIDCWINHFHSNKVLVKLFKKSKLSSLNKLRVIALESCDKNTISYASKKMLTMFPVEAKKTKLWVSVLFSFLFPLLHGKIIQSKQNNE